MTDYSIIIPAYNEEAFLPSTLEAVSVAIKAIPEQGEVIVANNLPAVGVRTY